MRYVSPDAVFTAPAERVAVFAFTDTGFFGTVLLARLCADAPETRIPTASIQKIIVSLLFIMFLSERSDPATCAAEFQRPNTLRILTARSIVSTFSRIF